VKAASAVSGERISCCALFFRQPLKNTQYAGLGVAYFQLRPFSNRKYPRRNRFSRARLDSCIPAHHPRRNRFSPRSKRASRDAPGSASAAKDREVGSGR
jgi:hypothetical protein